MEYRKTFKTNLNRLTIALMATVIFGVTSCSEDETSEPTVDISFNAVNTQGGISAGGRTSANTLAFRSGTIT